MPLKFDLCIASDWEYDADFIQLIIECAQKYQISVYVATQKSLTLTIERLKNSEIEFGFFIDRASDTSPEFLQLYKIISELKIPIFDRVEDLRWASNKATMHLEFIAQHLYTPYTIILSPYALQQGISLSADELFRLGRPFIVKPATISGGGIGVLKQAWTENDIYESRKQFQDDFYLLQEKVYPFQQDDRRFWFRGFYCCGLSVCTWWNDMTHLYSMITDDQIERYGLWPLFEIVEKIAQICHLHFFSTEIVMNERRNFIVVDYVNEICDMRLQSLHPDGVPDELVRSIAHRIVVFVRDRLEHAAA